MWKNVTSTTTIGCLVATSSSESLPNDDKQVDILISKNQVLQIYLKYHDNVYKTP